MKTWRPLLSRANQQATCESAVVSSVHPSRKPCHGILIRGCMFRVDASQARLEWGQASTVLHRDCQRQLRSASTATDSTFKRCWVIRPGVVAGENDSRVCRPAIGAMDAGLGGKGGAFFADDLVAASGLKNLNDCFQSDRAVDARTRRFPIDLAAPGPQAATEFSWFAVGNRP